MATTRVAKERLPDVSNSSGIALFMVIAAMSILSILVTEFTYISQINQKIAFDALDQVRAHYLMKSGFKLSLLRLKAYQHVKGTVSKAGGAAAAVPKAAIDKIWSFPLLYPIPTAIPGLSLGDKEAIEKFQKESGLEGNFTASIESESSRYNLNMILAAFVPTTTTSSTTTSTGPSAPGVTTTTVPPVQFDPDAARASLYDYLFEIYNNKIQSDQDFADLYKGFRLDELTEAIWAWADRTYDPQNVNARDTEIPLKRAPFYSLTELHMVPGMDDALYELFAPALTVSATPGINVNTMKEPTFRALVPGMTDEEVQDFFKFREDTEADNSFKAENDFFTYLQTNIARFRNDADEVKRFREALAKRNIRIVVDETDFKITVQATVNNSTRLLEAWVSLSSAPKAPTPANPGTPPPGTVVPTDPVRGDPGLRITFMRIL